VLQQLSAARIRIWIRQVPEASTYSVPPFPVPVANAAAAFLQCRGRGEAPLRSCSAATDAAAAPEMAMRGLDESGEAEGRGRTRDDAAGALAAWEESVKLCAAAL